MRLYLLLVSLFLATEYITASSSDFKLIAYNEKAWHSLTQKFNKTSRVRQQSYNFKKISPSDEICAIICDEFGDCIESECTDGVCCEPGSLFGGCCPYTHPICIPELELCTTGKQAHNSIHEEHFAKKRFNSTWHKQKKDHRHNSSPSNEVCGIICDDLGDCIISECPDGVCCDPGDPFGECCPLSHPVCIPGTEYCTTRKQATNNPLTATFNSTLQKKRKINRSDNPSPSNEICGIICDDLGDCIISECPNGVCCDPGDPFGECCPLSHPVCIPGTDLCTTSDRLQLCNAEFACTKDSRCCGQGCCNEHEKCCGNGCCEEKAVCCGHHCCPIGSSCCDKGCCA